MKQFQPCPKCGNCGLFRKSEKEHGAVIKPSRCGSGFTPEWTDSGEVHPKTGRPIGIWFCVGEFSRMVCS